MKIEDLSNMSLQGLQTAFSDRTISPVEVMNATFDQIETVNGQINALYDLRRQEALAEALASERRYASGDVTSPFDGVPVTIKDSVNAIGMRWHHGSAVHGDGLVAKRDSPPAERLKRSGAVIIGKGAMPDFGLSGSGSARARATTSSASSRPGWRPARTGTPLRRTRKRPTCAAPPSTSLASSPLATSWTSAPSLRLCLTGSLPCSGPACPSSRSRAH